MHKTEWYFKGYGLNQKEIILLKKFLKAHKVIDEERFKSIRNKS